MIDEQCADTFSCDNTTLWAVEGIEGNYESYRRIHAAFPDGHLRIDEIMTKPDPIQFDKITVRYTFTGTHTGPLVLEGDRGTEPPTGRPITVSGVSMLVLIDWKMVAARALSDLMTQLDIMPPPEHRH